jgi:hypothetical protein
MGQRGNCEAKSVGLIVIDLLNRLITAACLQMEQQSLQSPRSRQILHSRHGTEVVELTDVVGQLQILSSDVVGTLPYHLRGLSLGMPVEGDIRSVVA